VSESPDPFPLIGPVFQESEVTSQNWVYAIVEGDSLLLIEGDFRIYHPDTGIEKVCKDSSENEPTDHV
jgi:hypothetical protein